MADLLTYFSSVATILRSMVPDLALGIRLFLDATAQPQARRGS